MRHSIFAVAASLCVSLSLPSGTCSAPKEQKKLVYPKDQNVTAIKDLVEGLGLLYESHSVTTEDGYILNLNRLVTPKMVKRRDRGVPILLVNGLFMHSEAWMIHGLVDTNIAGTYAKKGYDVWMGDQRGTLRSMRHVNLTNQQQEFWDFSFHETGLYDLPAFIDFILKSTGHKRLVYNCMSLGCTFHFVLLTKRPEYNDKFIGGIDFVPVGKVLVRTHLPMPAHVSFMFLDLLAKSYEKQKLGYVRDVDLLKKQMRNICSYNANLFGMGLQTLFGRSNNFDYNILCEQISLAIGGTSMKTIVHVLQMFDTGDFAEFNYGRKENLRRYGTDFPPLYDLRKITSFVALYYSERDIFAPSTVIDEMLQELGGPTYRCGLSKFHHLDVAIGKTFRYVFPDVCELLDSLSGYANDTRKARSGVCPSNIGSYG